MIRQKIILYGLGKFADYVKYILENDSEYIISALSIESKYLEQGIISSDLPVISFEEIEIKYPPEEYKMFIAIGNNQVRERIYLEAKTKGYNFISYISSRSITWPDLKYGENVFITEDSAIQPFVEIGNNTFIYGAKIGHHSKIGNNTLITCSFLAGNVKIGNNSFLAMNSTIKQNISIGANNIIGMSSLITMNTSDNEIFTSSPAKKRNIESAKIMKNYLK